MHFALGRLKGIRCRCGYLSVITRGSHYDVLGVSKNATQEQIKARYYELSKKYHPDVSDTEESADKFRAVAEAYEVLGNVDDRRTYDKLKRGPGERSKRDHISVSEDYSQHLRDRFHHSNRSSSRSRGRAKQHRHYSSDMRRGMQSEDSLGTFMCLTAVLLMFFIYNGISR